LAPPGRFISGAAQRSSGVTDLVPDLFSGAHCVRLAVACVRIADGIRDPWPRLVIVWPAANQTA